MVEEKMKQGEIAVCRLCSRSKPIWNKKLFMCSSCAAKVWRIKHPTYAARKSVERRKRLGLYHEKAK